MSITTDLNSIKGKLNRTLSQCNTSLTAKGSPTVPNLSGLPQAITDIKSGAELNIAYGDTAPTDTSKLWCKCAEPKSVEATNQVQSGKEQIQKINTEGLTGTKVSAAYNNGTCYIVASLLHDSPFSVDILVYSYDTKAESTPPILLQSKKGITDIGFDLRCCYYNDLIYIFSGESIYVYRIKENTITKELYTIGDGAFSTQVNPAVINSKIYGLDNGTVYEYDIAGKISKKIVVGMPSTPSYSSISVGSLWYVFYANKIFKIDIQNKTSQELKTDNVYVENAIVGVFGGFIYLFGGKTRSNGGNSSNRIVKYNIKTNISTVLVDCVIPFTTRVGDGSISGKSVGYIITNNKLICKFSATFPLTKDKLLLSQGFGDTRFNIINTDDMKIGSSLDSVYRGNASNEGEPVEAYLHNGSNWELI